MSLSSNNIGHKSRSATEEQILLPEAGFKNGSIISAKQNATNRTGRISDERIPLTVVQPVKLTPAWEERNLPNDELNFKGVTMEEADLETNPPSDRYKFVYFILLLHGIGTLMPWNMFINAKSYFVDYKLSTNYTGVDTSVYTTNFLPYIGVAGQAPNLLFNWLNVFVHIGGTLTSRIIWSITVEVLVFVGTVILVILDTSSWPQIFFFTTVASIFILNTANGIYQNTVYGLAAKLPQQYTGAVILGSNVSGTFASVISMMSALFAPNARTAAIYYFVTALFILLACFDTYFALPLNRFYKYHDLQYQKAERRGNASLSRKTPYWHIFKKCFPQCFNVFFIFFVTLSIFPAVHSDIKSSDPDFFIDSRFFIDITCFLTFNFCAMLGNLFSTVITVPGPRTLVIPVVLRVLFVPLFLLLNYQPYNMKRIMPVLIHNDWCYWSVAILFGFTSGYFSSLAMMYCPRMVEPQYSVTAGMFGAASLITGVFTGLLFSAVFPWLVTTVAW